MLKKEIYYQRIESLNKEIESGIWSEKQEIFAKGKIEAYEEIINDIENENNYSN